MLGEGDRVSYGAQWVMALLAEGPGGVVLAWGGGVRSLQACGGSCLDCWEQGCGERWRVCLGDDSAPMAHWPCLEAVSVVTTGMGAASSRQGSGRC